MPARDELGLPEADVAYEDLQDPYGITMWPEFKGRDGCRTPMPWTSAARNLGFSNDAAAKPWLPVSEAHRALAVDTQEKAPDSLLVYYRQLLAWRKTQPALLHGDIALLPKHEQVLAYVRSHEGQKVLCVFNMSETAAEWTVPAGVVVHEVLHGSGLQGAAVKGATVELAPFGGVFALID